MSDYPACIDCKYSYKEYGTWMCSKFPNEHIDYVSGKKWQTHYIAAYHRESGECGKDATAFEPKEHRSFWKRLRNIF